MRKRNRHVSVWMTEAEYRHLKQQADLAGMGIDPFLRNLAAGVQLYPRPPDTYVLYGKYLLKELKTLSGYVLLDDPIPVEITNDGQTVKLPVIINKRTETKTDIPNTGEKKNIAVAGLVLILCIIGAAALFLHERRRRKK